MFCTETPYNVLRWGKVLVAVFDQKWVQVSVLNRFIGYWGIQLDLGILVLL